MWLSQDIIRETVFLLHSFLLGAVITFIYDGFLIARKLIRHSGLMVSLEDLVFWIVCALKVFRILCTENNGMLRWFAVAGAFAGMLIYKKTLSRLVVRIVCGGISFLCGILMKVIRFLAKPAGKLIRHGKAEGKVLAGRLSWLFRCLKKKLTMFLKMLKMVLNKK